MPLSPSLAPTPEIYDERRCFMQDMGALLPNTGGRTLLTRDHKATNRPLLSGMTNSPTALTRLRQGRVGIS